MATQARQRGTPRPAPEMRARIRQLALVAEGGPALFAAGAGLLHLVRPDLDPRSRTLSEYALGRDGGLMILCFLALGVGALALSAAMALDRPGASVGRLVLVLLGAFGLGTLVCAACPTDLDVPHAAHTVAGRLHDGAASVALLCGLVAMPVAAWGWRSEARWRELSGPSVGLALLAGVGLPLVGGSVGFGAAERLVVGVLLLWQVGVAHRLRDTVVR